MLTQCSQCSTVFRIHALQLAAAHGFVTCGECDSVFNALTRLADEPLAPAPLESSTTPAITHEAPPRIVPQQARIETMIETPILNTAYRAASPTEPTLDMNEVPAILREDMAKLLRRRGLGLSWAWSMLAFVALLMLTAQLAWHYRAWWSLRYPAVLPYAEQLCARSGCSFAPAPSVKGIELVARDVREHPQYAHTLLVNATLANRSPAPAAYPVIQLGVFDRNGGVIGLRRFDPAEYLDASIDIARGLPAGRSIYVVLEIAGASDLALSFEFSLL